MYLKKKKNHLLINDKALFRLISVCLFIYLFSHYDVSATEFTKPLNILQREEDRKDRDDKRNQERWENEQERQAVEDKREESRLKSEVLREQQRGKRDAQREMRDRCERAEDDLKAEMKERQTEREKWEEKFYDLEGKITELESKNSEKQVTINEKLDELKKDSNKTIQEFKDNMAGEIKEIDEEIKKLEQSIAELSDELDKVEETRMTAFYARRKQQNDFYSKCFGQALQQTEKERTMHYQKTATRTLKRKDIGALVSGGKTQTKNVFSARFNSFLNLCLYNEAALLEKDNHKNEYELALKKLLRQEDRAKEKIEGIKEQIKQLSTTSKLDIMNRFKQKMEAEINIFSQSYDTLTANYQRSAQQTIKEIEKIKQNQAYILNNRSQIVQEKTRSRMISSQCQGMDMFNMFSLPNSGNKGLFNSSTSSGTVH